MANEIVRMEDLNVIANVQQGSIKFNYEETKAQLEAVLAEYQGAVFTDDSIKTAKVIVAELRAKQKEFDKRRKEVKTEYNKTLSDFEDKAKELNAMFDVPINFIVDQIEGYEERRKAEKKAKCEEAYKKLIGEFGDYLPLSKIYNPKWENATFRMSEVEQEITALVESTEKAICTIQAMNSEAVEKALQGYKQDLSLANAITYINNYEKQKAEILEKEKEKQKQEEERRAQELIEKAKREEREKLLAEQKAEADKQAEIDAAKEQARVETQQELLSVKEPAKIVDDFDAPFNAADLQKAIFTVLGSAEEIEQVEMYMNSIGVEYTKG